MEAVIAGWVAGYIMAIVTTIGLVYLVIQVHRAGGMVWLAGEQASGAILAIPISIGTTIVWGLIGIVVGIIFDIASLEDGADGLGSASIGFTAAIIMLAATPAIILGMLWPGRWRLWSFFALSFAGTFGWLMPFLATR